VDRSGNVYLTGFFHETAAFDSVSLQSRGSSDGFVQKLNPSGVTVWALDLGGSDIDFCRSNWVDPQGNCLFVGHFSGEGIFGQTHLVSNGSYDMYVGRIGPSANPNPGPNPNPDPQPIPPSDDPGLTIHTEGDGKVLGEPKDPQVGRHYVLRARATRGWLFSEWNGTFSSPASVLRFVMQESVDEVAVFVPNLFLQGAGVYTTPLVVDGVERTLHLRITRGGHVLGTIPRTRPAVHAAVQLTPLGAGTLHFNHADLENVGLQLHEGGVLDVTIGGQTVTLSR
jgi:hypothetical protein